MASDTQPELSEVVQSIAQASVDRVNVALPARVIVFDPATLQVKAQPVVQLLDRDGNLRAMPVIGGVPVHYPGGAGFTIVYPIAPGDIVTLLFCSQSIEDWLASGTDAVPPGSSRRHSLSDAIAIPGLTPFTVPNPLADPVDMLIGSVAAHIRIKQLPSEVLVGDSTATSPAAKGDVTQDNLQEIVDVYNTHTHANPGVPPTQLMFPDTVPPFEVPSVEAEKVKVK